MIPGYWTSWGLNKGRTQDLNVNPTDTVNKGQAANL